MSVQSFTAQDLFEWLVSKESFLLLDVRNEEEFGRFKVEGPYPFETINVPYMEFIEHEEESVAKNCVLSVPRKALPNMWGRSSSITATPMWLTCWWASRPGEIYWLPFASPPEPTTNCISSDAREKRPAAMG